MDKVVNKTLKLGYYYYSLVKICGILWLAKQILLIYFKETVMTHGDTNEHENNKAFSYQILYLIQNGKGKRKRAEDFYVLF